MLINLSNHPFATWSKVQVNEASLLFDDVVDLPFPYIDADKTEEYIEILANEFFLKIMKMADGCTSSIAVHLMGEMTFCFALLKLLQKKNIACFASTTNRNVKELKDGEKLVNFDFVRFRKYT